MTNAKRDKNAIQTALTAIQKQQGAQLMEAIRQLEESGAPHTDMVLLNLLDSRCPEVRGAAVNALMSRKEVLAVLLPERWLTTPAPPGNQCRIAYENKEPRTHE